MLADKGAISPKHCAYGKSPQLGDIHRNPSRLVSPVVLVFVIAVA
jgi:hypothetical protein